MYNLSRSGIYALIDKRSRYVYICYSHDVIQSLSRNISQIASRTHRYKQLVRSRKRLDFVYLENIHYEDSRIDIASKVHYWIEYYKNLEYTVLNKVKIKQYKVRTDITTDKIIHVKLISRSYKELVVGVFDNMIEANEFAKLYKQMNFITPIYSTNALTRAYVVR